MIPALAAARARRDFMAANPLQESPEEGETSEEEDKEDQLEEELPGDADLERNDKSTGAHCFVTPKLTPACYPQQDSRVSS